MPENMLAKISITELAPKYIPVKNKQAKKVLPQAMICRRLLSVFGFALIGPSSARAQFPANKFNVGPRGSVHRPAVATPANLRYYCFSSMTVIAGGLDAGSGSHRTEVSMLFGDFRFYCWIYECMGRSGRYSTGPRCQAAD